jgi:hypothetical protein
METAWPASLTIYYPVVEDPARVATLGACWIGVAALVAGSVWAARRRRAVAFAWMIASAALLPALNLAPQLAPKTDHYVQWALPGLLVVALVVAGDALARLGARGTRVGPWLAGAAVVALAGASWMRVPEFASRDALFARACAVQPGSAVNLAGQVHERVVEHGGRYQPETGALALAATTRPDVRRMLEFTVADTAVEAGVAAWRAGGRAEAARRLGAFSVGDPELALLIQGRVLIGAAGLPAAQDGGPERLVEADGLLSRRLGAEAIATAARVGARCRAGAVLPDAFPPVALALPASADAPSADAYYLKKQRRDALRLLLVLSEVRTAAGDAGGAFDLAALAFNQEPDDEEARANLAAVFTRAGRADLAEQVRAGRRP